MLCVVVSCAHVVFVSGLTAPTSCTGTAAGPAGPEDRNNKRISTYRPQIKHRQGGSRMQKSANSYAGWHEPHHRSRQLIGKLESMGPPNFSLKASNGQAWMIMMNIAIIYLPKLVLDTFRLILGQSRLGMLRCAEARAEFRTHYDYSCKM